MECQNCAFNPIVKALADIQKTYMVTQGKRNVQLNAIEYLVYRTKNTNKKISAAAEDLLKAFAKLKEFVETKMLPVCQNICKTCSKTSDDDNLSRGGQTMISFDAMPGEAGDLEGSQQYNGEDDDGGEAGTDESRWDREFFSDDDDDDAQYDNRGNWLNKNAIQVDQARKSDGVTNLPVAVENEVKAILASFRDLTTLQQMILIQRWNEMSFVDIGSMTWVPTELKHPNDKQLVGFWWKQIVRKCPWAEVLSSKKRKSNLANRADGDDDYKTHSPSIIFVEQELDFGMSL